MLKHQNAKKEWHGFVLSFVRFIELLVAKTKHERETTMMNEKCANVCVSINKSFQKIIKIVDYI